MATIALLLMTADAATMRVVERHGGNQGCEDTGAVAAPSSSASCGAVAHEEAVDNYGCKLEHTFENLRTFCITRNWAAGKRSSGELYREDTADHGEQCDPICQFPSVYEWCTRPEHDSDQSRDHHQGLDQSMDQRHAQQEWSSLYFCKVVYDKSKPDHGGTWLRVFNEFMKWTSVDDNLMHFQGHRSCVDDLHARHHDSIKTDTGNFCTDTATRDSNSHRSIMFINTDCHLDAFNFTEDNLHDPIDLINQPCTTAWRRRSHCPRAMVKSHRKLRGITIVTITKPPSLCGDWGGASIGRPDHQTSQSQTGGGHQQDVLSTAKSSDSFSICTQRDRKKRRVNKPPSLCGD